MEAQALKRNRPLALEIEARLLAGQTASEIAELTGTSSVGVLAYEELFFNILDRLDAEDYIAFCVVRRNGPFDALDGGYGVTLRRFAYVGGADIIGVLLRLASHRRDDGSLECDLTTAEGRLLMRAELAMMAEGVSIDDDGGWSLLRVLPDLLASHEECMPKPTMIGAFASLVPEMPEKLLFEVVTSLQGTSVERLTESRNPGMRKPESRSKAEVQSPLVRAA